MPDKAKVAVCGLFCPSCTIYIATHEDKERLKKLAVRRNQAEEELRCDGCRAKKRTGYCKNCKMSDCAGKKGIDFCYECEEYPCAHITEFQSTYSHRIELWKSQDRIREAGYEKWYEEMIARYSCPECGTINSAYDLACRKCGHNPSCDYVKDNMKEILRRIAIKTIG